MWVIRKFIDHYDCTVDIAQNDHRQATTFIVSECVKYILKSNSKIQYRPHDVTDYKRRKYGHNIS